MCRNRMKCYVSWKYSQCLHIFLWSVKGSSSMMMRNVIPRAGQQERAKLDWSSLGWALRRRGLSAADYQPPAAKLKHFQNDCIKIRGRCGGSRGFDQINVSLGVNFITLLMKNIDGYRLEYNWGYECRGRRQWQGRRWQSRLRPGQAAGWTAALFAQRLFLVRFHKTLVQSYWWLEKQHG